MCTVHFPKANYKMSRNKCHAFDRLHRSYYLPRNLLIDLRSVFPFVFIKIIQPASSSFSWLKVFLIIFPILGCVRNDTFEFYRFYYELISYHCQVENFHQMVIHLCTILILLHPTVQCKVQLQLFLYCS